MRKIYYGIALLVFIALMALMYGGSMLISFEVVIGGILLAGERGIDMAYNFLMDYPNFFSIAVYLIPTAICCRGIILHLLKRKGSGRRFAHIQDSFPPSASCGLQCLHLRLSMLPLLS